MAGRVGGDEEWVGEDGAPRPADGAEAAELLGREARAQQDVEEDVLWQGRDVDASVVGCWIRTGVWVPR